jgi:hypothetical protein
MKLACLARIYTYGLLNRSAELYRQIIPLANSPLASITPSPVGIPGKHAYIPGKHPNPRILKSHGISWQPSNLLDEIPN